MKKYFGLPYEEYSDLFLEEFEVFFLHLLQDEGGYLPGKQARALKDKGGATNLGISLKFLRSLDIDEGDINNDGVIDEEDIIILTKEQAKELYFKYFYNPIYSRIKDVQLANRIFNFGVNAGKRTSVKLLQITINGLMDTKLLVEDGILGRNTLEAVNNIFHLKLYDNYIINISEFYRQLNKPQFFPGWINRLTRKLPLNLLIRLKRWIRIKADKIKIKPVQEIPKQKGKQ